VIGIPRRARRAWRHPAFVALNPGRRRNYLSLPGPRAPADPVAQRTHQERRQGMKLTVNGNDEQYDGVATVGHLLKALAVNGERVAVMVNEAVIRRGDLDATELRDGDAVEVITMVGGG
jgi:sulfur carrier protein